ncbi:hypothetical protein HKX41_12115, partial [Salinisphaera sp. USBA-960]|nr:hypothetical protein [Salifodinibacter halophilus]
LNGAFNGVGSAQTLTSGDARTAAAYQLLAGLAWKVDDRMSVDLTYRYLKTVNAQWATKGSGALQPGSFKADLDDNSVTVGIRYALA